MYKINKSKFKGLAVAALAALTFRWGIAEAYVIPSGSMEPTLQVGDRIFVNKLAYGVRVPFTKLWLTEFSKPRRGDVIVFRYPKEESTFFIKRVVGLPGDEIRYNEQGELFVNGDKLDESQYEIKLKSITRSAFGPVVVPQGNVFVMGDNRDNSSDSRVWGFLPEENILGKTAFQWFGYIK